MARLTTGSVARDLATLFASGTLANASDGALLDQYVTQRDESCFRELVARHGPLLLAICRRSLDDPHDVEDAFQAIFLTLIRKARSLRDQEALSSWLFGVALRVVRRARQNAQKRQLRERPMAGEPAFREDVGLRVESGEIRAIIDQEISRLPRGQQLAVMLCLLEGHTHEVAATRLGWPLGTLKSRIASARQTLTRRLTRRGLAPHSMALLLRPIVGGIERLGPISPRMVELAMTSATRALNAASGLKLLGSAAVGNWVQELARIMVAARIQFTAVVLLTLTGAAVITPELLSARPSSQPLDSKAPPPIPSQPVPSRKVDLYGDPLPPGAVMRLGTTRFRSERSINFMAYSPDGRMFVTDDRNRFLQVWDPKTGEKLRRIDSGIEHIRHFSVSPDGKTIAAVATPEYDGTPKGPLQRLTVTDVATGQRVHETSWREQVHFRRVFFGADSQTLITVTDRGFFQIRNSELTKILYQEEGQDNEYVAVNGVPNGSDHLIAICRPNQIRLFDTMRLKDLRTITIDEQHHVKNVLFSPDGRTLAGNVGRRRENNSECWLWNVSDGTLLRRFSSNKDRRWNWMVFSPDGNSLAAVNDQDQVISFDVATGKPLDAFPAARASSNPLVFSPDGATLATMDGDQALHFWDRATGNDRLATPDSHRDPVSLIKFIDSGKTLLSLGRDQSIRFWNTSTGTLSKSLTCDGSPHPFSFARRDDGMTVAAAVYGDLQEARVWDLQTQKLLWAYTAQPAEPDQDLFVYHVQLSPDASSVTTLLSDGSLRCWDVATGKERSAAQVKSLRRPDWDWTEIGTASCSPDARSIAVATQTGDIAMIDIPTGNVRFRTPASIQDPEDISKVRRNVPLQFAPDGQGLAFTKRIYNKINRAGGSTHTQWPRDTTLTWVDAQSGKTRREILIPEENVGRPTFSPDGQLIAVSASSSDDHNSIRIFRLRDKIEIQKIETGAAQIYSLAFTPDGSQIAAGLSDTSIVLWNVKKRD